MGLNRGQHIGFKKAFESMLPQIESFLSTINPGVTVHCIGHSLGGAVASIAAEWVASNKSNEVKLYTFGAPKPGTYFFAKTLTENVKLNNIFRVFHPTDPVPMTPMFPFIHPPKPGFGHLLQSNEGLIGTASHSMILYAANLANKNWLGLNRSAPPFAIEHKIKEFLQSDTPVNSNTPKILEWINAGLIYVLTKIVGSAINLASFAITGLMTVADTISYILIQGYKLSQTVWVNYLITKMMQALGMHALANKTELTQEFLTTIMLKMMRKNNEEAQKAISAI
ncbi:hypothetical protein MNBD_GAMMA07-1094 [hydrothermal vent metagenome]|uniref:Fungal lipase-type domain-containing protein n=1 Tax=hydrothermal vent metagenome TaxID=652676 RepID=A0A3B0XJY0_9ZZZZ